MLSNKVVVLSNQVLQVMVIVTDDFDSLTVRHFKGFLQ